MAMRGDGRIYEEAGSRFWWMGYYDHGKYIRQSTKNTKGETEKERESTKKRATKMLRARIAEVIGGVHTPHEDKVTLGDLVAMVTTDYKMHQRRSAPSVQYPFRPLHQHILARQEEKASNASIRIERSLLSKAFTLAVRARKLRTSPFIPKPEGDAIRVRQGFFSREEVEKLCEHLSADLADVVRFLFLSAWR